MSLVDKVGEKTSVIGWAQTVRAHGSVTFVDLRDRSGILQVVFAGEASKDAAKIKTEDLIEVAGTIQNRPEKLINEKIPTGKIELQAEKFETISHCANLPFEIDQDTKKINEAARLKYRYLDLRSKRMRDNLEARHKINQFIRNYMTEAGFWEVETPSLGKGTPEGAREFLVPSRLEPGKFYVLPQSPQQYKQLLMVAGVEKYFQIAKCFRDEDQRGDRQPEFTQLDVEMSFADEEDIFDLTENLMVELVKKLYPEKKIAKVPFPRIPYKEAMEKYQTDKPDLRENKDLNELYFTWIVDMPLFEMSESEGKLVSCHHLFTHPKDEDIAIMEKEPLKARAKSYDLVLNGYEVAGGSVRIHEPELQQKIFKILGLSEEEVEKRFGHMLESFKFSPPPHGGIAPGLDRIMAILQNEENIREVIAFAKTGDAKDLLFGAPSEVSEKALKDANIDISSKPEIAN